MFPGIDLHCSSIQEERNATAHTILQAVHAGVGMIIAGEGDVEFQQVGGYAKTQQRHIGSRLIFSELSVLSSSGGYKRERGKLS